jgi:hypothetical protein
MFRNALQRILDFMPLLGQHGRLTTVPVFRHAADGVIRVFLEHAPYGVFTGHHINTPLLRLPGAGLPRTGLPGTGLLELCCTVCLARGYR